MKVARLFLLWFVCTCASTASDWYVAAAAAAGGQGSITAPFGTIQAGVGAARPGDRVFVRGGTYREQVTVAKSATAAAPILITAYPGERPLISGSVPVSGWRLDHDAVWRRDGWTTDSQQVFVDGIALQQVGMPAGLGTGIGSDGTPMIAAVGVDAASVAPGRFFVDRAAGVLYAALADAGDPNQHVIEASVLPRLLMMNGSSWVNVSGLTFEHTNSTATSAGAAAVELGNWCTLRDCVVRSCDFIGVSLGYLQQRSQAIGVTVSGNGCLGFSASGSAGFRISGCVIAGNNTRMFNRNWQAGGAKVTAKAWGAIVGCDVVGNLGQGLWFDYANSGNPIEVGGCRVRDNVNYASGIMVEVSKRVRLHDNLISGNARRGVYIAASDDVDVAGNTITGNLGMYAIDVSGMPRAGATLTNVTVRNNLVLDNRGTEDLFLVRENGSDIVNLISDHNLFLRPQGDVALWSGGDARSNWRGTTYASLSAWQAATGQDGHSLQRDPRCLDRLGGDFRLACGSPAIDAGAPVPDAVDFAGVARSLGAAPDIGAFENWAPVISVARIDGAVGRPLSAQIVASNAPTAYLCDGLPPGLSLDPATGLVHGTPTVGGAFALTLSATNAGGTGTATAMLAIDAPPTAVSSPASDVAVVTGTSCGASAAFVDDGGAQALAYHWSSPSPAVSFTANDLVGTARITVAFTAVGSFPVTVTATDAQGLAASATGIITVGATPSAVTVAPAAVQVALNATQPFTAAWLDQFGMPMAAPPITWTAGPGALIDANGLLQAGAAPAVTTVTAQWGAVTASAVATVVNTSPRLTQPPTATVSARAIALDVSLADDGGLGALTTSWTSTSAPNGAGVSIQPNALGATATVTMLGQYTFAVVATDAFGLSATGTVTATVAPVPTDLVISPSSVSLAASTSTALTAIARDQFANALAAQPVLSWSSTAIGRIGGDGRFTAGDLPGAGTVTVAALGLAATVPVTVTRPLFSAHVNFQPAGSAAPIGYGIDSGLAYGPRAGGLAYGWNAPCESRQRHVQSDPRLDTLVLMQAPANPAASWRIAVPNGTYQVHVVCGDPAFFDGSFALAVNGALTVTGRASAAVPFREGTAIVPVTTGQLTLGSAAGSYNTKICYVEIDEVPTGNG